ncbi:hypothetical protein [Pelosinus sp. sgz500959]|uniref:hypothetical protein n=1 Tax=Pelosinus sp. sgz500959 TaxID=3242472 RepID=UPI00366C00BD
MGPCIYCGRLTADAEGICSHCQQRKQEKKVDISPELRRLMSIAERMSEQYRKPFRVIKNQRGELLVFSSVVPVANFSTVMYETGV